jgi:prepilin-type N-terminal cleavage/methylation domain-containing protein
MRPTFCCPPNIAAASGNGRQTAPAAARRGVTLVELLVVIMIMLMITAITIPVIAPSLKNRDVREAARMVDVFINGARTRAKLADRSYGVVLERMPGQPAGCVNLSYCEQPDSYSGDYSKSTIRMYNGAFAAWDGVAGNFSNQVAADYDPALPLGDMGWIQGPAPLGGWLTTLAPGDVITVQGTQYRIWAGEPFVDLNQDGVRNPPYQTGDPSPYATNGVLEPFADVDGNGLWTPPNPPPGQTINGFANVPGQPYVDPASGYFVQPNTSASGQGLSPFPAYSLGSYSAFITYWYYEATQAMQNMSSTGTILQTGTYSIGPGNTSSWVSQKSFTRYTLTGTPPMPTPVPNQAPSYPFSFSRRPIRTSAPGMQLPGGAVIDLGANYAYTTQPPPNILAIPGSGMEVLVANWNAYGWWSTFRPQPSLDPTLNGSLAQLGTYSADPTSIMITFQPNGTVDRVYSWSEAQMGGFAGQALSVPPNWTDWQGRPPAGPIYLLIGRQELLNGDPNLLPLIEQNPLQGPRNPIYNVQDPNALWVVINPETGAVATAENVGYDLNSQMVSNPTPTFTTMQTYWAANVYYARRVARAMLDMGGR